MAWLLKVTKIALGRHGLPAAVFIIGLATSVYAYVDRSKRTQAEQLSQLQDSAKSYELLLRHRLDLYGSANHAH